MLNENVINLVLVIVLFKIFLLREVCSKVVRVICKGLGFMKWRDEIEGNFEGMGSLWLNRFGFCNLLVFVVEVLL